MLRLYPSKWRRRIAALSTAAITVLVPSQGFAQAGGCPPSLAAEAHGAVVGRISSWDELYLAFRKYKQCDDGAIAGAFSEAASVLLAKKWGSFPRGAQLMEQDMEFRKFVLRHLDDSTPRSEWVAIAENANRRCPTKHRDLCNEVATDHAARQCAQRMMAPETLAMVKPLLQLRIEQSRDSFTDDGRWKGESPVTPEVNRRFEAILESRTQSGDEALVFLMTVYMGEHPGEELVCEAANRGRRLLPLIEGYSACPPLTGLEPFPRFVQGSGTLPGMAKEEIVKGRRCKVE